METTIVGVGCGVWGIGIMEKRKETTLIGVGCRVWGIGVMERKWKLL